MPVPPSVKEALNNLEFAQVLLVLKNDAPKESAPTFETAAASVNESFRKAGARLSSGAASLSFSADGSGDEADSEAPPLVRVFPLLGVAVGYVDQKAAVAVGKDAQVESMHLASAIGLIQPVAVLEGVTANAPLTWGLETLGIPSLWDKGLTGRGVRVGHLDTGVDATHKALRDAEIIFQEFDLNGNRVTTPHNPARDSAMHGTHTAGTICGGAIDGMKIGVAPGASLFSGMVIEGGSAILRVLAGMEWCIENRVRILSVSLGFRGFNPFFIDIMSRIRGAGVLPIIAIGNEGVNTSRSPGNYPESLAIGAMTQDRRIADFSSSAKFTRALEPAQPDMVAPGVDTLSARSGGGMIQMSGTSMATPHIAGIAALLFEAYPQATVAQVERAMISTCARLSGVAPERQGRGLVQPMAALNKLKQLTA